MKKLLLLCSLIIGILYTTTAQKYSGTISDYLPIKDNEIELQHQGANIYFFWKIYSLYGEPVVYGSNATTISTKMPSVNVIDINGKYCLSGTSIPSSILKKVRVKSVVLNGLDKKTGGTPSYKIKIDAGIPSQIYSGTYNQLKSLSKETRNKYWSFNVAGSPSWSKLFKHWDGEYLTTPQAKQLFKSGIKLKNCGDGAYQSHLSIEWDLSAVKEYLVKQKKIKLDREFATANKRKKQLEQKEALRKQKEAEDFWNTPVSTDTQQDITDRKAIKNKVEQYTNKKQKIASSKKAILKAKEEVEEYWAAKRNKLNNTPKPGENKGTFIDERDGHEYKWVKIGEQIWMAEDVNFNPGLNRKYARSYDNYYEYTWEVAQEVCPANWHIPTIKEWECLDIYLSGKEILDFTNREGHWSTKFGYYTHSGKKLKKGYYIDTYSSGNINVGYRNISPNSDGSAAQEKVRCVKD